MFKQALLLDPTDTAAQVREHMSLLVCLAMVPSRAVAVSFTIVLLSVPCGR